MIAVIFEFTPEPGERETYLQTAAELRALLDDADGFLSIERFESLSEPGKLLSLSFWRDQAAVTAWRNTGRHRAAQEAGRAGLFRGYRLRIAEVARDYGMHDRAQAPADSKSVHDAAANPSAAAP